MNDIIGKRFDRLIVIKCLGRTKGRKYKYECLCDCGNFSVAWRSDLKYGKHRSCGCLRGEITTKRNKENVTHGLSRTLTYSSWNSMIERCFSPRASKWYAYGAKGIVPCDFIRESPTNLVKVLGQRPSSEYSIDRYPHKNMGYFCGECSQCISNSWPKNIRWATGKQQGRNRTTNHLITIGGITRPLSEWAELSGIWRLTIAKRHESGWSEERLLEPPRKKVLA